jgi:hypothetical protein
MAASNSRKWPVRILNALIILAFTPSAVMKLMHHPEAVNGFTGMGIPEAALVPIGVVELACLALYLIARTAVLGTLLLTGYLGGATMANIVNQSDFIHALVIGLIVWAGAWLRVPEFRTLVPIRRTHQDPAEQRPPFASAIDARAGAGQGPAAAV